MKIYIVITKREVSERESIYECSPEHKEKRIYKFRAQRKKRIYKFRAQRKKRIYKSRAQRKKRIYKSRPIKRKGNDVYKLYLLLFIFLAACGSGGGSTGPNPSATRFCSLNPGDSTSWNPNGGKTICLSGDTTFFIKAVDTIVQICGSICDTLPQTLRK